MSLTTLCYIEKDDSYLMLHRVKKQHDVNEGKWIGVGGHFEAKESPEDCLLREVKEETGLTLTNFHFRGIITFDFESDTKPSDFEYMCLYTADGFEGEISDCREGILEWIPKNRILSLPLWEGDRIFLWLLAVNHPFFSLKLCYHDDRLIQAILDGKPLELFDIRDENGNCTGQTRERHIAHEDGTIHGTSHVWIIRPSANKSYEVLLQKRSRNKDAYPGCYDISSAGHLPSGEEFLPSALRELEEELGIKADASDLTFIGFHTGCCKDTFYGRPFHNYEISAVYLYTKTINTDSLHLQQEEVESVCWMPLTEVKRQADLKNPDYCIYPDELQMLIDFLS